MEEPSLIRAVRERGGKAEMVDAWEGADGLAYAVYAVVDERGRPKILVLKTTTTGYVKKAMQVLPSDVDTLAEALKKAKARLRELL